MNHSFIVKSFIKNIHGKSNYVKTKEIGELSLIFPLLLSLQVNQVFVISILLPIVNVSTIVNHCQPFHTNTDSYTFPTNIRFMCNFKKHTLDFFFLQLPSYLIPM